MSGGLACGLLCEIGSNDAGEEAPQDDVATMSDTALVAKAKVGGFVAFEELVRRYRNDVFALAHHFVRNREEAWDISQEVFIKAHKGLRRFRGDASFKTWLLRITANQCKDFIKKRRLKTTALESTRWGEAATNVGPGRKAQAHEIGEAILAALESLPVKQRTAFVLREFEGLSYKEIAHAMRCTPGTVMSRLHHARKKLQTHLVRMGVAEEMHHG